MYSLTKDDKYYVDQDGISWSSLENWFFLDILGGCGCGNAEEFGEMAIKLLKYFGRRDLNSSPFKEKHTYYIYELLSHWFDSVGLVEHGTIITSSWLTDKGKNVLECIEQHETMDLVLHTT